MTKQFSVTLDDKPGELAKLAGALADKDINIRTGAAAVFGTKGVVNLITSDDAKTRDVLRAQKFVFSEADVLIAKLEDKPGTLAQLAKNLAAAKVSIKSFALLSNAGPKAEIALTVDDAEKAKGVIK